jgi:hypothetical protein
MFMKSFSCVLLDALRFANPYSLMFALRSTSVTRDPSPPATIGFRPSVTARFRRVVVLPFASFTASHVATC